MKKLLLLVSLLIFTQISLGQDNNTQNKRPKVGLVLSGGGAKGLAHIGVLKVIDSLNIKIDYIAGTSMGAIVGGLYASGYNANQLDSIFSNIDVDALLQDYTPREAKSFYEKRKTIHQFIDKMYFRGTSIPDRPIVTHFNTDYLNGYGLIGGPTTYFEDLIKYCQFIPILNK